MKSATDRGGSAFRILIVDDDPIAVYLLRKIMKHLRRDYELYSVCDGVEALDFLHCRGAYRSASRPNLILLDLNMPRLGGLETLSAIKTDPELYVIPVIMLSSAKSPDEVRDSYQGHANCYVEKPADLEQSVKFIQALEAFWMDFALLPACNEQSLGSRQIIDPNTGTSRIDLPRSGTLPFGPAIACPSAEVSGRGTRIDDSLMNPSETPSESHGCDEHKRLLDAFGTTVRELLSLHEQQFQSIVDGDSECHRFDVLIHMANEQKQMAKYAYLRHVEAHGCSNNDAVKQAGT